MSDWHLPYEPVQDGPVWMHGESGQGARPMHPDWVRDLRDRCEGTPTAFFFKQWGAHDEFGCRVGKGKAGRTLDGRTWDEFPEVAS